MVKAEMEEIEGAARGQRLSQQSGLEFARGKRTKVHVCGKREVQVRLSTFVTLAGDRVYALVLITLP